MAEGDDGGSGILRRVATRRTAEITFFVDGVAMHAREGDSLLCAIASGRDGLRVHEFDGRPRAGFCGMGVCQDCWVWVEGGQRVRACTTPIADGLRLTTKAPDLSGIHAFQAQEVTA